MRSTVVIVGIMLAASVLLAGPRKAIFSLEESQKFDGAPRMARRLCEQYGKPYSYTSTVHKTVWVKYEGPVGKTNLVVSDWEQHLTAGGYPFSRERADVMETNIQEVADSFEIDITTMPVSIYVTEQYGWTMVEELPE